MQLLMTFYAILEQKQRRAYISQNIVQEKIFTYSRLKMLLSSRVEFLRQLFFIAFKKSLKR